MAKTVLQSLFRLVLLSALGFIFALLSAEAVLRGVGYTPYYLEARALEPSQVPDITYQLRPGFKGLYAGLPISINSMGYRGNETPAEIEKAAVRIVVIGDSVAFGQGVPDGQNLPDKLAARLRDRLKRPVVVVNLGVPGYDTCQESGTFRERALALKPQVALLIYVDNDTDPPSIEVKDGAIVTPDVRTGPFGDFMAWLRKGSAAYNFLWAHWQVIKSPGATIDTYRATLARKFNETNPGWRRSEACLADIARLAKAHSVRLIVVPFPVLNGLKAHPYPFAQYIQTVCQAARKQGAECVDVVPALENAQIPLRVSSVEHHPSAAVYERIAQQLDTMLP